MKIGKPFWIRRVKVVLLKCPRENTEDAKKYGAVKVAPGEVEVRDAADKYIPQRTEWLLQVQTNFYPTHFAVEADMAISFQPSRGEAARVGPEGVIHYHQIHRAEPTAPFQEEKLTIFPPGREVMLPRGKPIYLNCCAGNNSDHEGLICFLALLWIAY